MPLVKVRLELARTPEYPDGSSDCGYEFIAPLTKADGVLDVALWHENAAQCTVRRFWVGEADQTGRLVHRHNRWAFHYDGTDPADDEPIFKFDRHHFRPDDYISITEQDGVQRPFRVAQVQG